MLRKKASVPFFMKDEKNSESAESDSIDLFQGKRGLNDTIC